MLAKNCRGWCAAIGLLALVAAGCGNGDGDPDSARSFRPASDCASSDSLLSPASSVPGVTFSRSTDPTRTSLLMKNTGELTAVVIPDSGFTTRLTTAPYANPTDPASVAALTVVANSQFALRVPGLPAGISQDQVYVVPPGWAVCGLTDRLDTPANVRYLQDKDSSVVYFTAKSLAVPLMSYVTPIQMKTSGTLLACAEAAVQVAQGYPGRDGLDLYTAIVGDGSACRSAYKLLLSNDEQATRTVQIGALDLLERSPKLLETTRFVLALSR